MKRYAIFLLLLMVSVVQAEIYKWVDSAGNVHYGDQPETSKTKKMQKLLGLSTYAPPPVPETVKPQLKETEDNQPVREEEAPPREGLFLP